MTVTYLRTIGTCGAARPRGALHPAALPAAAAAGPTRTPRRRSQPRPQAIASAAFLAQAIAQETPRTALAPRASRLTAYRPGAPAAFEGLNYRMRV